MKSENSDPGIPGEALSFYRAIAEFAPDAIVCLDDEGRITYVNAYAVQVTGFSREELRGQDFAETLCPDDRAMVRKIMECARDGTCGRDYDLRVRARSGAALFMDLFAAPLPKMERSGGVVLYLHDITDRKLMDEHIFRAEHDWKETFDTISDMITIHDLDFNIIHANAAAAKNLHLPFLEITKAKCFAYLHGTARPPEACPSCRTYQTGQPSRQELFEPHLGKFLEIRAIPRFDREHQLIGLIHVVRDISDDKRAEEALRESERQYRLLFENNPLPLLIFARDSLAILAVNTAAIVQYGYAREEFLALTLKEIRPPEDAPSPHEESAGHVLLSERAGVFRHKKKNGTIFHVEITSHPLSFQGRVAVLMLVNDVTERKNLEDQLRHAQKMEAVGQLAGGVAHDFNNMLSVIVTYASIMQAKIPPESDFQGFLDNILRSADRAANLTRSLLTFSRKEAFKLEPINFNDVIQEITRLLQRVLGEQIHMRTTLCEHPLAIMADSGQIEQVIMNLCTNARDAMPQGGTLMIGTMAEEIGNDFIEAHGFGKPGAYAVLTVADTGHGMEESTRIRIFEPFFTTKEVGRGTGLGLAIVYGIIKQHDGFINVYSQRGEGTVFKIYLPLILETTAAGKKAPPMPPQRGTECILLAEDEEELRRIASIVLQEYGYEVLVALDGEEAVRIFKDSQDRIRLFLTDVIMPKKTGAQAYEEMRRINPRLKVLYNSGYTADFVEEKGLASGQINYITKPLSPFDLLRKVREILDRP